MTLLDELTALLKDGKTLPDASIDLDVPKEVLELLLLNSDCRPQPHTAAAGERGVVQ